MKSKRGIYLNNPNLPTIDAQFEYTPEMIRDIKRCKKDIIYFAKNFFYIVNLDEGKVKIKLYKCQLRALKKMYSNRFSILNCSRQVGKTTLMTIFALWYACFNEDQKILIVANKEATAQEIFARVRLAFEMLPNWLKPGVKEYGKQSMELANGSKLGISTTTGTAARGQSCNVLILDELAFIEPHVAEDFFRSVFPVISSSKKSKVFIASTPNGEGNLFYKLCQDAQKGENGWAYEEIYWDEIPNRDEIWKNNQISTLGMDGFLQEYCCHFHKTNQASVDAALLQRLKSNTTEPNYVFDNGNYLVWNLPIDSHIYVAGVDVSEGIGKDASVINILDITDLREIVQVGTYYNNKISPSEFTGKCHEILEQWGKPLVLIERNNCGAQVVDNLRNYHNYENIVSYGSSEAGRKKHQLGMVAHTNTKYTAVTNMRYWVNILQAVKINDIQTINELSVFIRAANGSWAAKPGEHDDRVMALVWALMILHDDICSKYFEVLELDDNRKPKRIKYQDYGLRYFINPNSVYNNMREVDNPGGLVLPTMFFNHNKNGVNSEIDDLIQGGWSFLNG